MRNYRDEITPCDMSIQVRGKCLNFGIIMPANAATNNESKAKLKGERLRMWATIMHIELTKWNVRWCRSNGGGRRVGGCWHVLVADDISIEAI